MNSINLTATQKKEHVEKGVLSVTRVVCSRLIFNRIKCSKV